MTVLEGLTSLLGFHVCFPVQILRQFPLSNDLGKQSDSQQLCYILHLAQQCTIGGW
jgi:hypothetical protein